MTKLEIAARQALEALENAPIEYDFHGNPMDVEFGQQLYKAITALREALAEQAEQSQLADATLEPVAKFLEDNLVVENERVDKFGHRVLEIREEELLRVMEIYAATEQQVDLTDDDIREALTRGGFTTPFSFGELK